VAEPLGTNVVDAALGVLAVVNAAMLGAIRRISVERGHDPREFALVPFGGAGPLHAAELARALEMPAILVPAVPGVLSALGLLVTDLRTEFSATRMVETRLLDGAQLDETFRPLEDQAAAWLEREGVPSERRTIVRAVDMRYVGQNHELTVMLSGGTGGRRTAVASRLDASFSRLHRQTYGHGEDLPTEVIAFRAFAIGRIPRPRLTVARGNPERGGTRSKREVWLASGKPVTCTIVPRASMRPGERVPGPAVIEQMDTTTLVLPGQVARLERGGHLLLTEARR
jgi:N-methylhydantoinase A